MSDADGLAAWYAACLDEAEALAKACQSPLPWKAATHEADNWIVTDADGEPVIYDEGTPTLEEAAFIAAVDPKHRLDDIRLKRAILAGHAFGSRREARRSLDEEIARGAPSWYWEDVWECVICGWFDMRNGGCMTVRQLGSEFAGQPGYLEEWKP